MRRHLTAALASTFAATLVPALAAATLAATPAAAILAATPAAPFAAAALEAQAPRALSDSAFAQLVASLSEPNGYFDTDNLISNEDSYLHSIGTLRRLGVTGGAYLGVGPDQNFSYIAAIRPRVAFILDIRRDNVLEHLLFKSLFALARNRLEYLCLLFGEPPPADTTGWGARDIEALLRYVDSARTDSTAARRIRTRVLDRVKRASIPLSQADLETIARFHLTFVSEGPALRFTTFNRPARPYYPDYRRLLLETDRTGRRANYLVREADFQFVKSLEDRNLVIPLVGNFAGDKALAGTAQWLRAHGETVSAFYTSNVEQYLFRDGSFPRFEQSVAQLPRDARSVMVRSYFMGGHPQAVAGYNSVQLVQSLDRFVATQAAGGFASYYDLVTRNLVEP
ncbi:MAG TPA: hypothetical protein VHE78_11875 [Gemmatimonadaceae bacterium]|nr:hypothetical protein [Gemmatimonadaceae bacterium]